MINQNQQGYIAISIVLLTMAVVIGVATTVSFLAIGEAESSLTQQKGEDNWDLVDGCTDDALLKIQSSSTYPGGTITRPEGTCSVVILTGNPNWNLTVTTVSSLYKRTVQVQVVRGTQVVLSRWQEI